MPWITRNPNLHQTRGLFICGAALLCSLAPAPLLPCSQACYKSDSPPATDETPSLSQEEKDAGFGLLFNGKDLTNWEHNGKPGTFEVKDGLLLGVRKNDTAYWLSTKEAFGDFELRLEYRIPPKGNSGVFIRAPREGRT